MNNVICQALFYLLFARDRKDIELTHMYGNSMGSTQSQRLTRSYCCMTKPCYYYLQSKEDIELTHAWEHSGISFIIKTYCYVCKKRDIDLKQ